jgi:hypothetical protein
MPQKILCSLLIFSIIYPVKNAMSSQHDKQTKPSATLMNNWQFISDGVMGGQSKGELSHDEDRLYHCLHLKGEVTTANNGGFLQIAHELTVSERSEAIEASGIRLLARGNDEYYNVHLRSSDMNFPWQSYRASFLVTPVWQEFSIPFDQFEAYKTTHALSLKKLRRIGIVAIGRDFEADICIADVQFY